MNWRYEPMPGVQEKFVNSDNYRETFYAGRGAGKTEALMMATVRAVQTPGVRAMVLAPNYPQLSFIVEPLIDWIDNIPGAKFNYGNQAIFLPNGSSIWFQEATRMPAASSIILDFLGVDNVEMIGPGWKQMEIRLRGKTLSPNRLRVTENRWDSYCDDPDCLYNKKLDNSS